MKIKTIFGMGLICLILLSSNVYATERISEEKITISQEYITEEITRENAVMLLSETEEPTIVESWDISETEDDNVTATLYSDGTLIISGNGKMKNWTSSNNVNWHEFIDNIMSVTIEKGVTSIGNYAFDDCSSLTSVDIPEGLTSIESYAFSGCSSLTSVNIPGSVTNIGEDAFAWCSSLTSVNIPEGLTSIESCAFYKCSSLTDIEIPEGVSSIGVGAFAWCSSLTSVNIPSSVTSIRNRAFLGCSSLTSVDIPEGVTSIGYNAFEGCSSLMNITVDSSNPKYSSENDILYNKDKTELIMCAGKKIGKVEIPSSVTSIENFAFNGCSSLTDVNIPSSVASIGVSSFYNCSSLTSVNIPEGVTSIGNYAFYGCSSLTNVNIPSSVTSIVEYLFTLCSGLTNVNIQEGVTNIGSCAFYGCSSLTSVNIPSSVTNIGGGAFRSCNSLTNINIPEGVTSIGSCAFYGCSSLTNINIPKTVTSIGDKAFYGCKTIIAVQIGANSEQEITINLPSLLKRTLDEEDIMYANGVESTLANCSVSTENQTIKFNTDDVVNKKVKVTINDGALGGLTVVMVPSGTILYNRTDWTNEDVTANIYVEDGETITNNDGRNTYKFNQNGEYTFTYADKEGNTYSSTAKVDWIDKEGPTITSIEGNFEKCIQTTLTINAEDSLSGLATQAYSFDGGENWQESNTKEFTTSTENIIIQVRDKVENITIYEPINVKIGHKYKEIVTEPTCTEGGYTTHTCTRCEDTYKDNQTEALGHNYGEWIITKEATCTEKGIEERTCSICGEKETIEVAEKGHTEVIDKAVEATCTKTGLTEGKHCSVCGKILIAQQGIQALGHNYEVTVTEPTCTEGGYTTHTCTRCGDSYTDNQTEALGHNYGEWIIDKEATTEEEGHKYRVCTRCNDKQEETIAKISEEETIISTTYIVKEKENKKYITIDINTTAKETLENITCNKEIEIIGKDEEKIENEQTIRTGAIIRTKEDSEEQYIVVVKGDINGNGKIDFLNDVVLLNNYRLNRIKLSTESILAGDINGDDKIDFINDIVKINNYRLKRINKL